MYKLFVHGEIWYFEIFITLKVLKMYAIIKSGGKQYKVYLNDIITLEQVDIELGSELVVEEVLMIGGTDRSIVGAPLVKGAKVVLEAHEHRKTQKVIVFKKQRRQHYRRKNGHRQKVTQFLVKKILTA